MKTNQAKSSRTSKKTKEERKEIIVCSGLLRLYHKRTSLFDLCRATRTAATVAATAAECKQGGSRNFSYLLWKNLASSFVLKFTWIRSVAIDTTFELRWAVLPLFILLTSIFHASSPPYLTFDTHTFYGCHLLCANGVVPSDGRISETWNKIRFKCNESIIFIAVGRTIRFTSKFLHEGEQTRKKHGK